MEYLVHHKMLQLPVTCETERDSQILLEVLEKEFGASAWAEEKPAPSLLQACRMAKAAEEAWTKSAIAKSAQPLAATLADTPKILPKAN